MDQEQIKSEIKQYINRFVDEKKSEIKTLSDKELKKIQQANRGYNSIEREKKNIVKETFELALPVFLGTVIVLGIIGATIVMINIMGGF